MLPFACACFPPLAEGQSGRLGRRCYSRSTPYSQTANHGLSARVPRDSPEERIIMHPSASMTSDSPEERNSTLLRPMGAGGFDRVENST